MSLDRTENVELVDAPKELVLSKLWKEQYTHLRLLYNSLLKKSMKAVRRPIKELGTVSEDVDDIGGQNFYRYSVNNREDIWDQTPMEDWPHGVFKCIKFSAVRKLAVTFNRNANPEWNYQKAENRLSDYKALQEELGDNEHAILPDVTLPKKPVVMPFIEQASRIIQEWMLTHYNFEAKSFIRKPVTLVVLRRKTGAMKRKVLIGIDTDNVKHTKSTEGPCADWEVFETEEVFDATPLLLELEEIVDKYDVQSVYSSLQHHVSHLEKLQCNEDEDEDSQTIDWES